MKITVVGMGYVGMSNAVLLAQYNEVVAYDIVQEKINLINLRRSPIMDDDIDRFFKTKKLNIKATSNIEAAFKSPDYVIIATPTNFNEETNCFDTKIIELIVKQTIELAPNATIIIKSTIPIGFTHELLNKYQTDKIHFSPEFLREGKALYDNLFPSRIIVGGKTESAKKFANLLLEGAEKSDIEVLLTGSTEAEAIKLFSNTYLALRVSYFNEVDNFASSHDLDSRAIIKGVCLDPRIGSNYNNPSFGYGGYCLPKDTKQLQSNFKNVPQVLISATIQSNYLRKKFIAEEIISKSPKIVGVYRLLMKKGSDNFRESAVFDIINYLNLAGIEIIVYEPKIANHSIKYAKVINDLEEFKRQAQIILANRLEDSIKDVNYKVYTRDIFNLN